MKPLQDKSKEWKTFCQTKDPSSIPEPITVFEETVYIPKLKQLIHHFTPNILDNEMFHAHDRKLQKRTPSEVRDVSKKDWFEMKYLSSKNINIVDNNHYADIEDKCKRITSTDWFIQQNRYILTLSMRQIMTVRAYTLEGDVLCNNLLLNDKDRVIKCWIECVDKYHRQETAGFFFPLFYQVMDIIRHCKETSVEKRLSSHMTNDAFYHVLEPMNESKRYLTLAKCIRGIDHKWVVYESVKQFIKELDAIVKNAPVTTECITAWRGVKSDYIKSSRSKEPFLHKNFMSVALNIDSALPYANDDCCLKRVILPVGTPCLSLLSLSFHRSDEAEILIGSHSMFNVKSANVFIKPHTSWFVEKMLCDDLTMHIKGVTIEFARYDDVGKN